MRKISDLPRGQFWSGVVVVVLAILMLMVIIVRGFDLIDKIIEGSTSAGQLSITIEVNGVGSSYPVSVSGNVESVTLPANTPYTLVVYASGSNCTYHYSGSADITDVPIHGREAIPMIAPDKGQVIQDLFCMTSTGSSYYHNISDEILKINVADSGNTPQIAATSTES